MNEEYWITKTGEKIAVGDMDVNHLKNTLRLIIRKRNNIIDAKNNLKDDIKHCFEDFERWLA